MSSYIAHIFKQMEKLVGEVKGRGKRGDICRSLNLFYTHRFSLHCRVLLLFDNN